MNETIKLLASRLQARGWWLGTAESCTGGLLSAALTGVAGSSQWFERGIVCYSNAAKQELLNVSPQALEQHGAVSIEVAEAMATGMLSRYPLQLAVSITGIAGPGGGSREKPVGLVCMACGTAENGVINISSDSYIFEGDRDSVRLQATEQALRLLLMAA